LICVLTLVLIRPSAAVPAAHQPRSAPRDTPQQIEVLFLSSLDPDMPDVAAMIEQAETQILVGSDKPVRFSFDYLDFSSSLADASHKKATGLYLADKYRGATFQLVIAIGEETLIFAEQAQPKLFPDATLLFFVVNPQEESRWRKTRINRTGVIRKSNYLPTLQLALRQNPGTSRVIVVSGSSDGEKLQMKLAQEQFRAYESNLKFEYLTDISFAELGPRLASAQPGTVIVFLDFATDSSGEQFIPSRILPVISRAATRPIYGTFSSVVGKGAVGGNVADLTDAGRLLGHEAARILKGEKAENILVTTGEFQRYVVDWRELHRWGLSEAQLPPDSILLNWEYSPWELYRWRILGLSAVLLIETLLIVLLLRNIVRRKRAQEALRQKEAELADAQRLARVGDWLWDPKKKTLAWSKELYRIHGLDPSTPPPSIEEFPQLFTPESWERLSAAMQTDLKTGSVQELDLELVRPDGSKRWVTTRGAVVSDVNGHATHLHGTTQDITERKQADEARSRLASIVESSDDAIISKDLNGIIQSWNWGAERTFGYTEAEAVGQRITLIIPPELRPEEDNILQNAMLGQKVEHYETVRVTKAGKRINVSLTISPLKDSAGKIVGSSKIARDITERRRVEEELKKSEEKFAKAFRQSPMALGLLSATTDQYLEVNKTFEEMTGYCRADVLGKSDLEVRLWTDLSARLHLKQRLLAEGFIRNVECAFRTKYGHELTGLLSAELIEFDGQPCILAVVANITDRKRAEQSVQESEERFRLIANTAPVLIWMSSTDKLCNYFNQPWLEFTGRRLEQELGNGWLECVHADDLQKCLDTYTEYFGRHEKFSMEYRLRRHDGEYRWIQDVGVPRFNSDGSFAGFVGCCMDISDMKQARATVMEFSGRLLKAGEQERARIARELHDDINQRLALLANGLQELEQAAARKDLPLKQGLRRLEQLTGEIATDVQRISHQLHPSKLHYLGLAAAVRDLCLEFAKQHKIEVECIVNRVPDDLDENASLNLFRTVQESLRNVAKHSQARHVRVELSCRSKMVHLRVSDDGVGFTPERAPLNPGLGLVSMQERLRSVGGEFSIWSKPSLGTLVEGTVPASCKAQPSELTVVEPDASN
jgi:PAS domain S-box-containing protein